MYACDRNVIRQLVRTPASSSYMCVITGVVAGWHGYQGNRRVCLVLIARIFRSVTWDSNAVFSVAGGYHEGSRGGLQGLSARQRSDLCKYSHAVWSKLFAASNKQEWNFPTVCLCYVLVYFNSEVTWQIVIKFLLETCIDICLAHRIYYCFNKNFTLWERKF